MEERSTIAVHRETRDRLNEMKRVDSMTYDDVIRVLIKQADPEEAELIEASDVR
jgi:predicted CopG family antitoxin